MRLVPYRVARLGQHLATARGIHVLRRTLAPRPIASASASAPANGISLVVHEADDAEVARIHRELGRRLEASRISKRFALGFRFHALVRDGRALASGWTVESGERFIDEIGLGFRVGERGPWLRDVFVAPDQRGQGLFALLLDAMLASRPVEATELWSDVLDDNAASLRAHAQYGFEPVAHYRVVEFLRTLQLRAPWPANPAPASGYEPQARVLLVGPRYRAFLASRIA